MNDKPKRKNKPQSWWMHRHSSIVFWVSFGNTLAIMLLHDHTRYLFTWYLDNYLAVVFLIVIPLIAAIISLYIVPAHDQYPRNMLAIFSLTASSIMLLTLLHGVLAMILVFSCLLSPIFFVLGIIYLSFRAIRRHATKLFLQEQVKNKSIKSESQRGH